MLKNSLDYIANSDYMGEVTAILEDASRGSFELLEEEINLLSSYNVNDVCFADTTGCATPLYMNKMINFFKNRFPKMRFSVHCHNDLGLAVANSLSAIIEGCRFYYEIMNKLPYPNKPLIGEHAFSSCAGIHQDGIKKNPDNYEFINPEHLGLKRQFYFNRLSSKKFSQQDF
jgi:2-isopropylmalate synthase